MKTSCKSCQNWTPSDGDRGWCGNFKKQITNNSTCGEWRLRKAADVVPSLKRVRDLQTREIESQL